MRVVEGDNDLALLGRSQDSNNGLPDRRGSALLGNQRPPIVVYRSLSRQIKKAQSTRSAPLVRPKPNLTQLIPSESGAKTRAKPVRAKPSRVAVVPPSEVVTGEPLKTKNMAQAELARLPKNGNVITPLRPAPY